MVTVFGEIFHFTKQAFQFGSKQFDISCSHDHLITIADRMAVGVATATGVIDRGFSVLRLEKVLCGRSSVPS